MENNAQLIAQCEAKAKQWLTSEFDEQTRNEVKGLMENADKTGLIDAFYKDLEFGTGGLRGIMGAGSNRMNIYTVGMATQGLANYLKKNFANLPQIKVAVCHDCRNNSRLFAETVATCSTSSEPLISFEAFLISSTAIFTALSIPRFISMGVMPAATALRPSRTIE